MSPDPGFSNAESQICQTRKYAETGKVIKVAKDGCMQQ